MHRPRICLVVTFSFVAASSLSIRALWQREAWPILSERVSHGDWRSVGHQCDLIILHFAVGGLAGRLQIGLPAQPEPGK